MRLFLMMVLLVPFNALAAIPAHVQDAVGSTTTSGGSSSQAQAIYGSNTTAGAGHSQVCVVAVVQTSNGFPVFSISDTAGDYFAPRGYGNNGAPGTRSLEAWYVNTNVGGANTVTVQITSGPTGALNLHCSEWSGGSLYDFEFMGNITMINNQNPFVVPTVTTSSSNTAVILYGYSQQNATVSYSATGYTAGAIAVESSHGSSLGILYTGQSTSGTFSPSMSSGGGGIDAVFGLSVRSIQPALGVVEYGYASISSVAASLTCQLPALPPAGSMLHVKTWSGSYDDTISGNQYTPQLASNIGGETFVTVPNSIRNSSADGIVHFLHLNAAGTENQFTISAYGGGGFTQKYDLMCEAVVGVSKTAPIWSSTVGPLSNSSTTVPTGDIQVPAGNYLILSSLGDFIPNGYTASGGYNPVWVGQDIGTNYLLAEWSRVVSISSLTTYSNTATTSGSSSQAYADIVAFGVASNIGPRVIQVNNNGGAVGSTNTVTQSQVPVTIGDIVLVSAAWPGTGVTPTITESLGNTPTLLCGGTVADYYGIWEIPITIGGIEQVTVDPINVTAALAFEVAYTGAIDRFACNEAPGTSIGSGSIITRNPEDYVLAIGTWANPATCGTSGDLVFSGSNPPYIYRIGTTSHCGDSFSFDQYPHAIGTFSSDWTTGVTGTNAAGIFAFIPTLLPPGASVTKGASITKGSSVQP